MKFHIHRHSVSDSLPDLLLNRGSDDAKTIRKVVLIGCIVNTCLMLMKLTVGWFGHSEALIADGFHSMNDMAVDLIMLIFVGISYKQANSKYTYGYGKFETVSSLGIAALMIFIATMIMIEGIESISEFIRGEGLAQPDIWTVVAIVVAIGCKEGLYRYYTRTGFKVDSSALKAAGWHHRLDAMASIATLIGVTCAHFLGEQFHVLDPIASVVIAITIYFPAFGLLVPSFKELMDASMPNPEYERALNTIKSVPGVIKVEELKARRSGHSKIFDVKIAVKPGTTVEEGEIITANINKSLRNTFCPHIYLTVGTISAG